MRWSELRSRVEAEFAPEVRDRISLHYTHYRPHDRDGRAWFTVDGVMLQAFCDQALYSAERFTRPQDPKALAQHAEFSTWDFKDACWALLHEGADACLASDEPMRQALAALHRKIGKRRLAALLADEGTHPLVRALATLRAA
jgi:hypothetical protein